MHVTLPAIFLPPCPANPCLFPCQLDLRLPAQPCGPGARNPAGAPEKAVSAQARPERKVAAKACTPTGPTGQPFRAMDCWRGSGPCGCAALSPVCAAGAGGCTGRDFALLVMLHGCRQTGSDLAAISRMNRIATRKRFLCSTRARAHGQPQGCWNWYERRSARPMPRRPRSSPPWTRWRAAPRGHLSRVAVAGLSAGASMAALLAALYPTRFCAVAMHSGVAPGTAESAANALAAMRGTRDAQLPDAWPALPAAMTDTGLPAAPGIAPAAPAGAAWRCRPRGVRAQRHGHSAALGPGVGRPCHGRAHRGARAAVSDAAVDFKLRGQLAVSLREIAGLDHAWSGGASRWPLASDPAGPDASALIWALWQGSSRKFEENGR